MKHYLLLVGLIAVGITGWSSDMVLDDFYGMATSEADARSTSLDSQDAQALKEAGVYFFALVNGVNSTRVDKKNLIPNAKMAVDYFEAAYALNRRDPVISIWRATANLAYAGVSKKLKNKIKYSNLGISHFNQIPMDQRNNLDYLYMRIISFIQVPKSFKNLTDSVKKDSQTYIKMYSSLENPEPHDTLIESVKVMQAYAYYITRKKKEAKKIMLTVNEELMLSGQGDDTTPAEYYFTMKKKLKIK